MLAGKKAFRGESITALIFKIITEEPPPHPRAATPTSPTRWSRIITKALSKAPEARYQTGRELADDLLAFTRPGSTPTIRQIETPTAPGAVLSPTWPRRSKARTRPAPTLNAPITVSAAAHRDRAAAPPTRRGTAGRRPPHAPPAPPTQAAGPPAAAAAAGPAEAPASREAAPACSSASALARLLFVGAPRSAAGTSSCASPPTWPHRRRPRHGAGR